MDNKWLLESVFSQQIRESRNILNTGVLSDHSSPFLKASFTQVLINLNYALQYLNTVGKRIDFKDGIENGDITDLINTIRNSACHIVSGDNFVDTNLFSFNTSFFNTSVLIKLGEKVLKSEYEDDVAFFYGDTRIYLNRHIMKAQNELEKVQFPSDQPSTI